MKIAISTADGTVSAHFGRCPQFTIIEVEDGKVINKETIANPGHEPGFLPKYMAEQGVSAVIAGGAGNMAQRLFAENNIELVLGVTGDIDTVVEQLCDGTLKGGESLCTSGGKHGDGHSDCDHHH
ncbi:MAG: NifB/NifX family molybdenum-iron cluster-binding protein [candidate division KSB1 bacterium]|jgi:predicted Fe-Mo cluster-binding NifX family protein|nr:NifB/NifX family molybdenum-iron cluster-binding protein [candidate division KSB1 bacterium]